MCNVFKKIAGVKFNNFPFPFNISFLKPHKYISYSWICWKVVDPWKWKQNKSCLTAQSHTNMLKMFLKILQVYSCAYLTSFFSADSSDDWLWDLTVKELFSCLEGMKSGIIPGLFSHLSSSYYGHSGFFKSYIWLFDLLSYTVITSSQL